MAAALPSMFLELGWIPLERPCRGDRLRHDLGALPVIEVHRVLDDGDLLLPLGAGPEYGKGATEPVHGDDLAPGRRAAVYPGVQFAGAGSMT